MILKLFKTIGMALAFVAGSPSFCSQGCMRVYSFYTDSHAILKDNWFLPSLKEKQ